MKRYDEYLMADDRTPEQFKMPIIPNKSTKTSEQRDRTRKRADSENNTQSGETMTPESLSRELNPTRRLSGKGVAHELEGAEVLLAANQAGNNGGLQEFTKVPRKLLKASKI